MFEDSLVEVRLFAGVVEAEEAGVVADEAGNEDDEEGEGPASIEGHNGEYEDQAPDHAVDDTENGHGS